MQSVLIMQCVIICEVSLSCRALYANKRAMHAGGSRAVGLAVGLPELLGVGAAVGELLDPGSGSRPPLDSLMFGDNHPNKLVRFADETPKS